MSGTTPVSEGLRALFEAKARAELERADAALVSSEPVPWSGDPLGRVFAVKGAPDPEDADAGRAFAGPDGEALRKGIAALGLSAGTIFFTVARPARAATDEAVRARLALQLEAVDPSIVVATDAAAATDLAAVVGADRLDPGKPTACSGRRVLALEGLRASLADASLKRRVWAQMKALTKPE